MENSEEKYKTTYEIFYEYNNYNWLILFLFIILFIIYVLVVVKKYYKK